MHNPGDSDQLVRFTRADAGAGTVAAGAIVGATILGLNAKSNVAAVLAFTAAVLVALLTAYWTQRRLSQELRAADRRQVRQLDAENARQAQQLEAENLRHAQALDAERQRLELQLAHDRRLHDLEELRKLLDAIVTDLAIAVQAYRDCARVAQRTAFDQQLYTRAWETLQARRLTIESQFQRLSIRGTNDVIVALHDANMALSTPSINNASPNREIVKEAWTPAEDRLVKQHGIFLIAARALVSSELPD